MSEPIVFQGLTQDQATATARFHANQGASAVIRPDGALFIVQVTYPDVAPDTASGLTLRGKMSTFGGPNDTGVGPDEGLALVEPSEVAQLPEYFLPQQPDGTTGLARRLDPKSSYIACRWDYGTTTRSFLKTVAVKVTNPANGKSKDAKPVDWGPNASTGRVADLSPGLARFLGLNTDFPCEVVIPTPPTTAPAPPEASAFVAQVETIATQEWNLFGNQTYDINGHATHVGHKEGEEAFYQHIGTYWLEGTNTHGVDGRVDLPWSAAFISWVMKTAGAGARFRYSTQHSVYINQSIRDHLQNRSEAGFWGWRLNEKKPEVGDLVCWSRESGIDYDHQSNGNYKGHTDIVVEVLADRVNVIGGNVGNSVTRRPLPLNANGFLRPSVSGGEILFALMENRIA